ncbi:hypothetical protein N9Y41_02205 [Planktomarina temperata]|nr:hypothetical protein [Planktomarina temperata]
MNKLIYALLTFLMASTAANASGQDSIWKCAPALRTSDLDLARKHAANIIILSPVFGETARTIAIDCLNFSFGNGWLYDKSINSFINGNSKINALTATLLNEEQSAAYYRLISNLVYLTKAEKERLAAEANAEAERLAAEANAEAERLAAEANAEAAKLELRELKSQLAAMITNLEKRAACVSAKSFQTNAKLDAISKRFEQSNNTLILDDTHEACTELYSSNKSAAMLNQTCVEAFQRMGHPKLVFSEAEPRAEFTAELSGLVTLKTSLEEELMEARVKLLEAEGVVTEEGFNQQVSDDLEAKSCAEFGYEGVYLD